MLLVARSDPQITTFKFKGISEAVDLRAAPPIFVGGGDGTTGPICLAALAGLAGVNGGYGMGM